LSTSRVFNLKVPQLALKVEDRGIDLEFRRFESVLEIEDCLIKSEFKIKKNV